MSQSPPPYPPVDPAPEGRGQPTPPPPSEGPQGASGLAIAALTLGILGLCIPLVGVVALILGIIALNRADDPARGDSGRGMATAGTILGGIGLVLGLLLPLLIGILLPALGAARATAQRMQSNTQIRSIHQAKVVYAQSNNGYFPGLDPAGEPHDITVTNRYRILLDAHHFTPEYLVSPSETDPSIHEWRSGDLTEAHYSFAMLSIGTPGGRRDEWSETLSRDAIVLGDRNTGQGSDDHLVQSIHRPRPGDWRGGVARNDNSVSFEVTHRLPTGYGGRGGAIHHDDNIFDAQGPDDALLIHAGE